jgi:transposase
MGLLRPSFVPPPEIRALRDLTRTRQQLVKDRTREWQRLEKLLEGALVKLSSVVHSLARTKTARGILEAIAVGRSVLVIIWHLLADPAARFTHLGPRWHDDHAAGRDHKIRNHLRQLRSLGLEVTVTPSAA